MRFTYRYRDCAGVCDAKSVAQAVDRIKIYYLEKQNIKPGHPRFRLMKKQLTEPWRLELTPEENQKFRLLYRAKKDGDVTAVEQQFIDAYHKAVQDLAAINPQHLHHPMQVTH